MANMHKRGNQSGAVLLVGLIVLMVAMAAGLMALFGQRMGEGRKEAQTAQALAQAKQGLLGYAANAAWWGSNERNCINQPSTECARPGELPCPDLHPAGDPASGQAGSSTGNPCPANALGRLPWRTLGLPDLRDGSREQLWYARSERFRNRNRFTAGAGALNPDTAFGQITVRSSDGVTLLHQASAAPGAGTGAVAVIIAPGAPLRRLNNLQQNRGAANFLTAAHYLDCWGNGGCGVEDNANFVSGSPTNGFIAGPIRVNGEVVVNDRVLTISRNEVLSGMNQAVANQVAASLNAFLVSTNQYLPSPASVSNAACLNTGALGTSCPGVLGLRFGRIPATLASPPTYWPNATSALVFFDQPRSWFHRNGWREHVFYALAPACINDSPNCSAPGGLLTVNNPPGASIGNRQAVVIVGGATLPLQARISGADRANLNNYLEEQNVLPPDDVFAKRVPVTVPVTPFNDAVATIPR